MVDGLAQKEENMPLVGKCAECISNKAFVEPFYSAQSKSCEGGVAFKKPLFWVGEVRKAGFAYSKGAIRCSCCFFSLATSEVGILKVTRQFCGED